MRGFVVAIALGAGLFTFGGYLEPRLDLGNPAEIAQIAQRLAEQDRRHEDAHITASVARGFGMGFMTLGGLGLVVPWINALLGCLVGRNSGPPQNGPPKLN